MNFNCQKFKHSVCGFEILYNLCKNFQSFGVLDQNFVSLTDHDKLNMTKQTMQQNNRIFRIEVINGAISSNNSKNLFHMIINDRMDLKTENFDKGKFLPALPLLIYNDISSWYRHKLIFLTIKQTMSQF